jgi:glutamate/tyrosine decarboxylase-like PLP-dependent enzyme
MAMAALPEQRANFAGMELADSIAFDPCKWMFTAFGLGCLFLKDGSRLRASFDVIGHYWQDLEELEYFRLGFYGTRQWRSLGLWFCLRSIGASGYRKLLRQLLDNASALRKGLQAHGGFELLPGQNLPVVCLRPRTTPALADAAASQLHQRINDGGKAYLTMLDWRGQSWVRAAFNNYSTSQADVQTLMQLLIQAL